MLGLAGCSRPGTSQGSPLARTRRATRDLTGSGHHARRTSRGRDFGPVITRDDWCTRHSAPGTSSTVTHMAASRGLAMMRFPAARRPQRRVGTHRQFSKPGGPDREGSPCDTEPGLLLRPIASPESRREPEPSPASPHRPPAVTMRHRTGKNPVVMSCSVLSPRREGRPTPLGLVESPGLGDPEPFTTTRATKVNDPA